ncbi:MULTISPECIES: helicase HerA-like domain-containing protein [unclassified Methanoregula]|uniref:helicase HerA-like domain-containing protein n=1 Tax=unclassified Methanoregula TaxID=2649730 RepID=UPI0025EB340E|nr:MULTISPECIES: helicase HerA-like domain-containing protein [unclassified Methanoregula]
MVLGNIMPDTVQPFTVAKGAHDVTMLPAMANRHGLIAGATGTGKTTTLRLLAENFSAIGVPVFLADIKGDLSGLAAAGGDNPKVNERAQQLGITGIQPQGYPVTFWDAYGAAGHPVRTTISDMGPLLLARILDLNDIQTDVLTILFKIADDQGLLLLDLKDLRAMAQYCGDHAKDLKTRYGNISPASIGSIQRSLLALEQQGGDRLFGEPALDVMDFVRTDSAGRGMINILAADRLMQSPKTYATFLLWLLSELFEKFPEAGDVDKPKLVFFFDEAHLLFADTPKMLEEKIVQVVRLIRSKGIGVYFVTQNPLDLPDPVLGQLGNRVHHALRAFTPKDAKNVKGAAGTLRPNPSFDTAAVMTELQIGEVLISLLDEKGSPSVVERAFVYPPRSRFAPLVPMERDGVLRSSPFQARYANIIDRESAYELLKKRADAETPAATPLTPPAPVQKAPAETRRPAPRSSQKDMGDVLGSAATSAARSVGTQLGRALIRGVLGSLAGKR